MLSPLFSLLFLLGTGEYFIHSGRYNIFIGLCGVEKKKFRQILSSPGCKFKYDAVPCWTEQACSLMKQGRLPRTEIVNLSI